MDIKEFTKLETIQKENVILQAGQFITGLISGRQAFGLYAVNNFYVEVEMEIGNTENMTLSALKKNEIPEKFSLKGNRLN